MTASLLEDNKETNVILPNQRRFEKLVIVTPHIICNATIGPSFMTL